MSYGHPRVRHPLGLPAGSVRALAAIMVIGTIWALLMMPKEKQVYVPQYLYYLAFLIVGSYFAGRGHAPPSQVSQEPSPLFLPRGTIRTLIFLGFAAAIGFAIYRDPNLLERDAEPPNLLAPLVLMGAFLLGIAISRLAHMTIAKEHGLPVWFQDTLAWLSVVSVLALSGMVIYLLVISPSVPTGARIDNPALELSLSGMIAFYFGARS